MKVLTTYHDPELLREFKAKCAIEGTPMTKVVDDALREFVQKKKKG